MKWFRGAKLKPLTFLAIVAFIVLICAPEQGYARENRISDAPEKADSITRQIDSKILNIQLAKLGLSEADISERIGALNDEELHHFASQAEHIYPGAGFGSIIIFTIIVLAAAYAYIKITGKRIVIE